MDSTDLCTVKKKFSIGSFRMIGSFYNLASANAASSSHDLIELECKGDWFDRSAIITLLCTESVVGQLSGKILTMREVIGGQQTRYHDFQTRADATSFTIRHPIFLPSNHADVRHAYAHALCPLDHAAIPSCPTTTLTSILLTFPPPTIYDTPLPSAPLHSNTTLHSNLDWYPMDQQ